MSRSVANPDPGSIAFSTLDPGSQTYIFESLMTNVWVKSTGTIILSVLAKKNLSHICHGIIVLDAHMN